MKIIFFFKFLKIPYSILHEVDKISHELYVMIHDYGSDFDAMLSFFLFSKTLVRKENICYGCYWSFQFNFCIF